MKSPTFSPEPHLKPVEDGKKRVCLAALVLLGFLGGTTAAKASDLGAGMMKKAAGYLGVLRDEAIPAEDEAWLVQRWLDEATSSPETTAAQIDHLAVLFDQHQKTKDPLSLANERANVLKNVYCTAAQSSDPDTARLRDILAPDGLVLAADCALGLVVTRFDIEGLAASHALVAAAVGQDHDGGGEITRTSNMIEGWFPNAELPEKELIARGEIRHAILARFWSRIDGTPGQGALIDAVRSQAATDLKGPARQLENLAVSKLGEVDHVAKAGDAILKQTMIGEYVQFLEHVAGERLSTRDRVWVQDAVIRDFQDDPGKTLADVEDVEVHNRNYRASGSDEEKAAMASAWAASLHCHLSVSDDPDERRLAAILFRHDPVIDADCTANRISRMSATVLAEGEGQMLTEGDLGYALRFASVILGRPLLPDEVSVVREDSLQSFDRDFDQWLKNHEFYKSFLARIDQHQHSVFLAMDERKKVIDPIYCALKASDKPFSGAYVQMFQRGDAILFEDCDQERVTTKDEIEAFVGILDFLALINGMSPLTQADLEKLQLMLAPQNMNRTESMRLALEEWWSLLTVQEKATAIESMRQQGITPDADAETLKKFIEHVERMVVVLNAKARSCETLAVTIQGMTAVYGASLGPGHVTGNNPSGIPGEQLAGLVSATNAARAICQGVFGG